VEVKDIKGIIHYEFVPKKWSIRQSVLKFWDVYSSTFIKKG
jgi:hypothetical protein